MSAVHYIRLSDEHPFDFKLLERIIERSLDRVCYVQKSPVLGYYWIDEASTRGVDVTLEEPEWVEIRNTSHSSMADYVLTNQLIQSICNLHRGQVFAENESHDPDDPNSQEFVPCSLPVFDLAEKQFNRVADNIGLKHIVASLDQVVTIPGPLRNVHFGPYYFKQLEGKTDTAVVDALFATMLEVNYGFPDYPYDTLLDTGPENDPIVLQRITNEAPVMIGLFEFVFFHKADTQIFLTNETLNQILPAGYTRLDEYNLLAPVLPQAEFEALLERAAERNEILELKKMLGE